MEFEYKMFLWIDPADLGAMVDLVRNGKGVYEAIGEVTEDWDDDRLYQLECVEDDVANFILTEIKNEQERGVKNESVCSNCQRKLMGN